MSAKTLRTTKHLMVVPSAALLLSSLLVVGVTYHTSHWPPTWGAGTVAPGLADLNVGQDSSLLAMSCPTPGNCSAGGMYSDVDDNFQAFVIDEVDGTWQPAEEAPGTAALNTVPPGLNGPWTEGADVNAISCATPGNCSAGGDYDTSSNTQQTFVIDEVRGVWLPAQPVPGAEPWYGQSHFSAISCATPGNCSAGGWIAETGHAFVVNEVAGKWGDMQVVALNLNPGIDTGITSIDCVSPGNCEALGTYSTNVAQYEIFSLREIGGVWQRAAPIPHLSTMNTGGYAASAQIVCPRLGDCTTGGFYVNAQGGQAWVDDEVDGRWNEAEEVPGTARLNHGETGFSIGASTATVSCAAPGDCAAGGLYTDAAANQQAFVANEVNGRWGRAEELPGSAALNRYGDGAVYAVSCPGIGRCMAGGMFFSKGGFKALVAEESSGVWAPATPLVDGVQQGAADAAVDFLFCAKSGSCEAGGDFNALLFTPAQVFFDAAESSATAAASSR